MGKGLLAKEAKNSTKTLAAGTMSTHKMPSLLLPRFEVIDSIHSKSDFLQLAKNLGEIYIQADDVHHEGIVTLRQDHAIPKYGFTNQMLFPHTDRSNMQTPPDVVLLWLEKRSISGGESLVFDAEQHLLPIIEQINFEAVWQSENDANAIREKLYDSERNIFRFRNDAYISLYGDSNKEMFKQVNECIQTNMAVMELPEKACLVMNNHMMLHGRLEFSGERLMHRILVYRNKPGPAAVQTL